MKFSNSLIAAALIFGMAATAHAGPVTWGAAQNTSGIADVSTNGTVVEAFNLTGALNPPATTTVNGVVFTNTDLLLNSSSQQNFLKPNSSTDPHTSGDADYDFLLNGLDFGNQFNGNPFTMQIGGGLLSSGGLYELQVWYTDVRDDQASRVMSFGNTAMNLVNLSASGTLDGTARLGQFAIGTFTASGGTQGLYMQANGFANVHMSAYQIRALPRNDVPEPGSLLLVGAALLGLAGAARRKR